MSVFLLTPLREGRPAPKLSVMCWKHFYSRPCGRGDRVSFSLAVLPRTFLLTPLREGRPVARSQSRKSEIFLLTPLREGRPARWTERTYLDEISTHAPAGGATYFYSVSDIQN